MISIKRRCYEICKHLFGFPKNSLTSWDRWTANDRFIYKSHYIDLAQIMLRALRHLRVILWGPWLMFNFNFDRLWSRDGSLSWPSPLSSLRPRFCPNILGSKALPISFGVSKSGVNTWAAFSANFCAFSGFLPSRNALSFSMLPCLFSIFLFNVLDGYQHPSSRILLTLYSWWGASTISSILPRMNRSWHKALLYYSHVSLSTREDEWDLRRVLCTSCWRNYRNAA